MNKEQAKTVIEKLDNEFDSHQFIEKFIVMYEKEYVELLYKDIESKGIFRMAHAKIGKFLANNSLYLSIEKVDKGYSENIKKYDSENQNWRKIL